MEIVDTIAPPEVKRGIDHTVPREDLPTYLIKLSTPAPQQVKIGTDHRKKKECLGNRTGHT